MQTALLIASAWVLLSLPISVLVGKMIACGESEDAPRNCGFARSLAGTDNPDLPRISPIEGETATR